MMQVGSDVSLLLPLHDKLVIYKQQSHGYDHSVTCCVGYLDWYGMYLRLLFFVDFVSLHKIVEVHENTWSTGGR